MDCPFDCVYLQEARKHERTEPFNPEQLPNHDIRVSEEFLEEHETLMAAAAVGLLQGALDTPGAVDSDVRDALDALIRTHRTLQSGVYYETRPVNALASKLYDAAQSALEEFRKAETEKTGMSRTRDADVLGILVFLQRLEMDRSNGRKRGRAFLDFLRTFFSDAMAAPSERASSLIVP